jgi:hypothetical protein
MNELLLAPLAGDREHTLDMCTVRGLFKGHKSKEGPDRSETEVAGPCARCTLCLLILQKINNERSIKIAQIQLRRRRLTPLRDKAQQQPKGVTIRGDGVHAGMLLSHQALGEEALDQRRQRGGAVHDVASQ